MTIIVCPLSHAPELVRHHGAALAVSLLDPGTTFPSLAAAQHLRMPVHDIEMDTDGADICTPVQMREILSFVGDWDRADPILIHCYAGISRSTATAFITACAHNPEIDEEAIALALRQASPTASPNRHFVALADAELGRGGRMRRAVEQIGRGATWLEIGEAEPFTMASRFGT